jgi:ribosomal protein S18 acetylase RimI-like enzyme
MDYAITKASVKDFKQCEKLVKVPEIELPDGTYPTRVYFKEMLEKKQIFLVVKKGDEVMGLLTGHVLACSSSFLDVLAVSPKHRGKGIGHALVSEYKKMLRKKKVNYIFLFATELNKKTAKFYEREGFIRPKHKYEFFNMNI